SGVLRWGPSLTAPRTPALWAPRRAAIAAMTADPRVGTNQALAIRATPKQAERRRCIGEAGRVAGGPDPAYEQLGADPRACDQNHPRESPADRQRNTSGLRSRCPL